MRYLAYGKCCSLMFFAHVVLRVVTSERVSFKGYKVVRVTVDDRRKWQHIQEFLGHLDEEADVWRWPESTEADFDVMLNPSQMAKWSEFCLQRKLSYSTPIPDVQSLVDLDISTSRTNALSHRSRRQTDPKEKILHRLSGKYPTFEEIEEWLLDLNRTEELVTVIDIGTTYEQRSLYMVKISAPGSPVDTPALLADTGMHAREWITQTAGVFIITQLVEGYHQKTKIRPLVQDLVWYVMPVVNPDGYVYSHTTNRFWRKNRAPPPDGVRDGYKNTVCIGVDLNRNWGFHWGEVGVSRNSCSVIYPGRAAMSELETQAEANFIQNHISTIHAYVNIHSYGQMFLTRFGYTSELPVDHDDLDPVAERVAKVMTSVHNVTYRHGRSPIILYPYSGGAADWAKGSANIKFSYSTELRDRGSLGFVLPETDIIPTGQEIFRGLTELGTHVREWAQNRSISQGTSETPRTTTSTNRPTVNIELATPPSAASCNFGQWFLAFLSSIVNIMVWNSEAFSLDESSNRCN